MSEIIKETRLLPYGLLIHVNGVQVRLVDRAAVSATEKDWEAIRKEPFYRVLEQGDPGFNVDWDGEMPVVGEA